MEMLYLDRNVQQKAGKGDTELWMFNILYKEQDTLNLIESGKTTEQEISKRENQLLSKWYRM